MKLSERVKKQGMLFCFSSRCGYAHNTRWRRLCTKAERYNSSH